MKIKQLIEYLQEYDQDLPVCFLADNYPQEITKFDVVKYFGTYAIDSPKMTLIKNRDHFVGIGSINEHEYIEDISEINEDGTVDKFDRSEHGTRITQFKNIEEFLQNDN